MQATTAREPDLFLIGALGILCNGGSRWTIQFGVCAKQRAIAGTDTANPTMIIAGSEGSWSCHFRFSLLWDLCKLCWGGGKLETVELHGKKPVVTSH